MRGQETARRILSGTKWHSSVPGTEVGLGRGELLPGLFWDFGACRQYATAPASRGLPQALTEGPMQHLRGSGPCLLLCRAPAQGSGRQKPWVSSWLAGMQLPLHSLPKGIQVSISTGRKGQGQPQQMPAEKSFESIYIALWKGHSYLQFLFSLIYITPAPKVLCWFINFISFSRYTDRPSWSKQEEENPIIQSKGMPGIYIVFPHVPSLAGIYFTKI